MLFRIFHHEHVSSQLRGALVNTQVAVVKDLSEQRWQARRQGDQGARGIRIRSVIPLSAARK